MDRIQSNGKPLVEQDLITTANSAPKAIPLFCMALTVTFQEDSNVAQSQNYLHGHPGTFLSN